MRLLRAITTEGDTEYFNIERILSLELSKNGEQYKILMGAGLHWRVWADSMKLVKIEEIIGGEENA